MPVHGNVGDKRRRHNLPVHRTTGTQKENKMTTTAMQPRYTLWRLIATLIFVAGMSVFWRTQQALAAPDGLGAATPAAQMDAQHDGHEDGKDDDGNDDDGKDDDGKDDDGKDESGKGEDGKGEDGKGEDDGHDNVIVRFGLLESRPEGGNEGVWVIAGQAYTVTDSTEFETEHGGFLVGVCIKVKLDPATPTVAKELETEEAYKCTGRENGDDDDAEGELYGVIQSLPEDGLLGEWGIGDKSFVVTTTTELKAMGGVFTVGVTVKVEFMTDLNDVNTAHEIKLVYQGDDDDDKGDDGKDDDGKGENHDDNDDDHYGDRPGKEGKTFGLIVERPSVGITGTWNIGGIAYVVDGKTKFYPNDDYQPGERVRVEYVVNQDESRRATRIKETGNHNGVSDPSHNKLVGFVEAKPAAFIGEWTIAGAVFSATTTTRFQEEHGLLTVGAYVSVEYVIENDVRRVLELETEVPPGSGDDDAVGKVELGDDSALTVNVDEGKISVDGVDYSVGSATMVLENGGVLASGVQVYVNSYTAANGDRMATLVRTVNSKTYLPLTLR
jgi:hypothetical protein